MKQENIDFLEANRHHYDTLIKAFYLRNLNAMEREGMQRVMAEEFAPGYTCDLWCPPCVVDMVKLLYVSYDNWLAAQPKEKPITVHANFPSHIDIDRGANANREMEERLTELKKKKRK